MAFLDTSTAIQLLCQAVQESQEKEVGYEKYIGQLPRVSGEDPERIRVDSVSETSVCLFFVCQQIFSIFVL